MKAPSFKRVSSFESSSFEDDLVVMHTGTRQTVLLNPVAAVLWESLQWPHSRSELVRLLGEAFPDEDEEDLMGHVNAFLQTLASCELVEKVEPAAQG
ncbi:PqqD family protein [Gemmatimonadota bacterium]